MYESSYLIGGVILGTIINASSFYLGAKLAHKIYLDLTQPYIEDTKESKDTDNKEPYDWDNYNSVVNGINENDEVSEL